MRIAIIGAGPSGMAQLRAFESAAEQGREIPEIVCFEKQADWGGQWNYSWMTGLDEHGEPVHSSMYRNLWSNGPKEALEFADYSFDEHFGRPISSYPPRPALWDYISGRVERAGVRKHVRFSTVVRWVDFDEATQQFTLVSEDHLRTRHGGAREANAAGHDDVHVLDDGHCGLGGVGADGWLRVVEARLRARPGCLHALSGASGAPSRRYIAQLVNLVVSRASYVTRPDIQNQGKTEHENCDHRCGPERHGTASSVRVGGRAGAGDP